MIRKILVNENGEIFHVYRIKDDHDPNSPNEGLEINEDHASLHQKMCDGCVNYRKAYIYDKTKGLRKRKKSECESEEAFIELKDIDEIPPGFVKKNLGRTKKK